MKTHKPLPPFTYSRGILAQYGGEIPPPNTNGSMIPVVTPSEPPHIHLPFSTLNQYGSQQFTVNVAYRGKNYYVGGTHLFLYGGQWVFQHSNGGRTVYFTADEIVGTENNRAGTCYASAVFYYVTRAVYGEMSDAGKIDFARRLLEEFNAYAKQNAAAIETAIREAAAAQLEEEIKTLETEIEKTTAELASKRERLMALFDKAEEARKALTQ